MKNLIYNSTFLKVVAVCTMVVLLLLSVSSARATEFRAIYLSVPTGGAVIDISLMKSWNLNKMPTLITIVTTSSSAPSVLISFADDGWSIVNNGNTALTAQIPLMTNVPVMFTPNSTPLTVTNNAGAAVAIEIIAEYE